MLSSGTKPIPKPTPRPGIKPNVPVKSLDDVKPPIGKDFNIQNEFKQRIEKAIELLDVPLKTDDPKLYDQLTLGNDWDDPFTLTRAMDRQPLYYARWATLLRKMKRERQRVQAQFDIWVSVTKETIQDSIFNENVTSGMTANNAKPTNQSVDNRFNSMYADPKTKHIKFYAEYLSYKNPLDTIDEQIDTVDIVVKAFEQRKDMMISLGSLVRSMIDNQILIYKDKARNSKLNEE